MGLSERINGGRPAEEAVRVPEAQTATDPEVKARTDAAYDRQEELKTRIHGAVIGELGSQLYRTDVPDDDLRQRVRRKIEESLAAERVPLARAERQEIVDELLAEVLGYGPIEEFLTDPTVTEVMVNGFRSVYVERYGKILKTDKRFRDDGHLRRIIQKIVGQVGRRVDESSPLSLIHI